MPELLRAERITTDPEPYSANLISPGFRVGDLVYISGQVAVGADQSEIVGIGDFDAQAEQVFKNMESILSSAGSGLDDVIKVTIYLTDIGHLPRVVELRRRIFTEPYPASTMVEVTALAAPEFMIEIEAVAVATGSMTR